VNGGDTSTSSLMTPDDVAFALRATDVATPHR
jgi:hypothetical protein